MTDPVLKLHWLTMTPIRRIVFSTILLFIVGILSFAAWLAVYTFTPGPQTAGETAVVTIPKGTSVRGIGDILAREKVIHNDIRFLLLAKLSGYGSRLQAGEFRIRTGLKPGKVLKELAFARSIEYPVTIPEGLRADEIAEIFGEYGWCNPQKFITLVSDKPFLEKLGFAHLNSLEGYLFPDTYHFTRDIHGAENIIPIMVKRFSEVWTELTAELKEQPDQQETVILASIVEKETGSAEERPLIAGVFLNRLKTGMRIQSDPTVIYGTKKFSKPISKSDLLTPTDYNTYTLPGLPVGPIGNPGKEALKAVLHPATTDTLYFVSKNDGTHQFSKTLSEHNHAVEKYQRNNSEKKSK